MQENGKLCFLKKIKIKYFFKDLCIRIGREYYIRIWKLKFDIILKLLDILNYNSFNFRGLNDF